MYETCSLNPSGAMDQSVTYLLLIRSNATRILMFLESCISSRIGSIHFLAKVCVHYICHIARGKTLWHSREFY